MQEIGKFNVIISVIPNKLKHHLVFMINRNLLFIDSMQFRSPILDGFVKNFSDNYFKYLSKNLIVS